MPETCWAVSVRQNNKFYDWLLHLVGFLFEGLWIVWVCRILWWRRKKLRKPSIMTAGKYPEIKKRSSVTFWPRSFTFNSNKSPTWCSNFSVYYPDVCLQLNMFRAFSRPSSGAQWMQWQPLVLLSYRGDSRAVFVVGPAGQKTPETCWAVNKRQDNKLKNCCIKLVIYLN
jgi:hypothetical protein